PPGRPGTPPYSQLLVGLTMSSGCWGGLERNGHDCYSLLGREAVGSAFESVGREASRLSSGNGSSTDPRHDGSTPRRNSSISSALRAGAKGTVVSSIGPA